MIADRRQDAGSRRAAADHPPGVRLRHGLLGQHRRIVAGAGAKQPAFAVFGDAGSIDGIPTETVRDLRDRALIATLTYSFARITRGAAHARIFGRKKNFPSGNVGGSVSMIRPDGSQPDPKGYTNGALDGPWGIAIDGDDNVWVGNSPGFGTVLLAGDDPKGRPPGTKTGDLIHNFTLGTIPLVTSAVIDPAGNVWVASNWLDLGVVETDSRVSRTSTWGGGNGVTVIYGVAAPVKTPLMGQVQAA